MNKEEVTELLNNYDINFKEFLKFMVGQTVGVDEKGGTIFYNHDVQRFLSEKIGEELGGDYSNEKLFD